MKVFLLCFLIILSGGVFSFASFAENEKTDAEGKSYADGKYTVMATLKGGSGRVRILSPVNIEVAGGKMTATVVWTSGHYEYMSLGNETYLPSEKGQETTTFRIPLDSFAELKFKAQTTRMSTPHEIEYSIVFEKNTMKRVGGGNIKTIAVIGIAVIALFGILFFLLDRRKAGGKKAMCLLLILSASFSLYACEGGEGGRKSAPDAIGGMKWLESEEIVYAEGFQIDYYEKNSALVQIKDQKYFFVPEDADLKPNGADGITVIRRPNNIYLTAPAAMAMIHDIGAMQKIGYTGTKKDSWALDYAAEAMNNKEIAYGGKYSSPDYERLVKEKCDLVVFSSMITHAPEVGEKFDELGIPIFIDYSSYEPHPLGRTEWIKIYGAMFDRRKEAAEVFQKQRDLVETLIANRPKEFKKTVAFFSISPSGKITARRYDDYVSGMIGIAGGKYAYHDVTNVTFSALSIVMEPEIFFDATAEADIIIYNATINGSYESLADMVNTNPILQDLPAVKNKQVWMTTKSFFQSTTSHGSMIQELSEIIDGTDKEMVHFQKLE